MCHVSAGCAGKTEAAFKLALTACVLRLSVWLSMCTWQGGAGAGGDLWIPHYLALLDPHAVWFERYVNVYHMPHIMPHPSTSRLLRATWCWVCFAFVGQPYTSRQVGFANVQLVRMLECCAGPMQTRDSLSL